MLSPPALDGLRSFPRQLFPLLLAATIASIARYRLLPSAFGTFIRPLQITSPLLLFNLRLSNSYKQTKQNRRFARVADLRAAIKCLRRE